MKLGVKIVFCKTIHKMLDYQVYKNNYYKNIQLFKQNPEYIKPFRVFEILWALKKEIILWDDIPPNFEDTYDIPHTNDYGIDLISLNYDKAGQVKHYCSRSMISWSDICKFHSYTTGILNIKDVNLYTTNEAKIDKMAIRLMRDHIIERDDFDKMLNDIPPYVVEHKVKHNK